MQYTLSHNGNTLVASLTGKLTFEDHLNFRSMLKEVSAAPQNTCQLDIRSLDYIDSAGLGLLLRAKANVEGGGKQITLKAPASGQVKEILDIAHFHQLFTYS